jgi:hypothetical protein
VSFSEAPDKYYFALRQEHMVVEADATMQAIMEKLQVYRNRLTILFEVRPLSLCHPPFALSQCTSFLSPPVISHSWDILRIFAIRWKHVIHSRHR